MKDILLLVSAILFMSGCTSVGNLGIVTKSTGDPGILLRNGQPYKEIGRTEGEACRFFILGILPYGDSAFTTAVDEALNKSGGDALLNVTVTSSLYGFAPIYNIFSFTCTTVNGIVIKFEKQ